MAGISLNMSIIGNYGSVMTMFKDVSSKLDGLSKKGASNFDKLGAVGKIALAGLATAAVGVGVKSVKMAADFQTSMTQLQTGAGESASNMKMVSDGVLSMAGTVGDSTKELADGLYHIESAGYHGASGLNILKVAAEGAKVGNADLDTMGKTLTGTLNSYGNAIKTPTSLMNMLVATTAAGDMRMQDLSSSLGNVAPVAAAAGISFQQVGGAIATMTSQNMSAQQATQDLANLIRSLQNPTSVATKEMAAMGLNSTEVAKNLGTKGLTGTISELTSAITAHMGPSGLVLQNSFNQSKAAANDANEMLKQLPTSIQSTAKAFEDGTITQKQWIASYKSMPATQANLAKQFATVVKHAHGFNDILRAGGPAAQTYSAALAQMTGGATGLNTTLMLSGPNAGVFADNVKKIGDAGKKTTGDVTGWSDVQKTFNQKLAEAKGHIEALGIKLGLILIPKVELAAKVTMNIVTWFTKHKAAAIALAAIIGGALTIAVGAYFVKLAKGLAESVKAFGSFLAKAPEAFETVALKGMYAADKIGTFASNSWSALSKFGTQLGEMAVKAAEAFIEMAGEALTWAGEMLVAGAEAIAPFLPIIAVVAALGLAAYELYAHWNTVWSFIKRIVTDAVDWVIKHLKLILLIGLGPLGAAIDILWTHWRAIWNAIKDAALAVWHFLYDNVIQPLVHLGLEFIQKEVAGLEVIWTAVWGAIREAALAVWHFLDDNIIHPLVNLGIRFIRDEIRGLQVIWSTAWGILKSAAQTVWNFLYGNIIQPIVNNGIHAIRDGIKELQNVWSTAWSVLQTVVQNAWEILSGIFDAIKQAAQDVENVIGKVTGAVGKVAGAIGGGLGKAAHFLGLDSGGVVPGPKGAPMLAIVHGGEYVLSNDMLSGNAPASGLSSSFGGGTDTLGGVPMVNVYVAGSVMAQQDLVNAVRQGMLQEGGRYTTTWPAYAR